MTLYIVLCFIPIVIAILLGVVWLVMRIELHQLSQQTDDLFSKISDYKLQYPTPRRSALFGLSPAYQKQLRWNETLRQNRDTLEEGLEKYLKEFARHQSR